VSGGVERPDQVVRLLGAFEGGDQVTFFVIKGEIRQVADLVEGGQPELFVAADQNIGVFVDLVMFVEFFHFGEGLIGGHDDLDIPEVLEIGEDRFGLVLTVFTVGAEEHDNGFAVLVEIVLGQVGSAVEFEETEGRNGGVAHKGCAGVGGVGSGLVGKLLSGYELGAG